MSSVFRGAAMGWFEFVCIVGAGILAVGAVSFFFSDAQARLAAIFALPQRRTFMKSRLASNNGLVRAFCDRVWSAAAGPEHADGRVNLATYARASLDGSALVNGGRRVRVLKRLVDIALSLTLLIFTLPITLVAALAIKLDSPGPIFYKQQRIGRGGKPFTVIKFRSMRTDAERAGAQWAARNDDRITRVGRFLRASRIDEIPQAFTILRGAMSFVGPRPERPEFMAELTAAVPHYADRHLVKPGLTGWAQVNFPYGASIGATRQKLTYDLYYIRHYSLLLDLFIVLKTVKVALTGEGSR